MSDMKIEVENMVENEDGSATFTFSGSKEDMEEFKNAMFSVFIQNAIISLKEKEMKILDDLNDYYTKITIDDYDKIENKLIQAKGIINITLEAYSASEFEDLTAALWAVSTLLEDIQKTLDNNTSTNQDQE